MGVTVFVDRDPGTGVDKKKDAGETQVSSEIMVLYLQKCMVIYLQ